MAVLFGVMYGNHNSVSTIRLSHMIGMASQIPDDWNQIGNIKASCGENLSVTGVFLSQMANNTQNVSMS